MAPTTSWKKQGGAEGKLSQTWVAPPARLTHPVGHLKYISQHSWQAQIYQTVGRTFRASQLAAAIQLKVRTGKQGISITPASSIPHTSLLACQPGWTMLSEHCKLILLRNSSRIFLSSYLGSEMWHWPFQSGSSRTPLKLTSWGKKTWPCLLNQLTRALSV